MIKKIIGLTLLLHLIISCGFTPTLKNLGNENRFSVLNLAYKILEITSSNSKIIFKDLPLDDPKQRKPDISLVFEKCGWSPKVSLEDGIKETVNYFRNTLSK